MWVKLIENPHAEMKKSEIKDVCVKLIDIINLISFVDILESNILSIVMRSVTSKRGTLAQWCSYVGPQSTLDQLNSPLFGLSVSYLPATHAVIRHAAIPATIPLRATFASSRTRCGAIADKVPIAMPTVLKLAKPHNAYAVIVSDRTYSNENA